MNIRGYVSLIVDIKKRISLEAVRAAGSFKNDSLSSPSTTVQHPLAVKSVENLERNPQDQASVLYSDSSMSGSHS